MISGRGLGHTGGTLDKLDAIPGYDTAPGRERFVATVRDAGLRDHRPDRRPRARRQAAVRHPRRHRHRRVDPAHRRLDPLQEAGRGARRAGDGRQGRLGRLPARARPGPRAGADDHRGRRRQRPAHRGAADRHGPRAGPHGGQRRRGARVDRPPHRRGERPAPARGHPRALRAAAAPEGARRRPAGRAGVGAAAEAFARMVAALGGPADLLERPDDHLPAAPVTSRRRPTAPASSPASTSAPSASPSSTSAAVGAARTTPSTTPSASPRSRRPASASAPRAARWPSSTPVTRLPPPVPPRRSRPPFASATACWTRTRRCSRS